MKAKLYERFQPMEARSPKRSLPTTSRNINEAFLKFGGATEVLRDELTLKGRI